MPLISVKGDDRVLITGKTGAGKTYLARYLTQGIKRLIVMDSKGTLGDWGLEEYDSMSLRMLLSGQPVRIRAIPEIGSDMTKYWDDLLMHAYQAGNVTIYIDELYTVAPPQSKPSEALWAVYTRGREAKVGVWASTQRPTWIPMFVMSEAEHFFVFRLQLLSDRQRMAGFMTEAIEERIRDDHGFWYMRSDQERAIYVRRLQVKGGDARVEVKVPTVRQPRAVRRPIHERR